MDPPRKDGQDDARLTRVGTDGEKGRVGTVGLVIFLSVMMLGHGALQRCFLGQGDGRFQQVRGLGPGDELPDLDVFPSQLVDPSAPECQLIIVADPACPHCRIAAKHWRVGRRRDGRQAMWIVGDSTPGPSALEASLPPWEGILTNPVLVRTLDVRAVPATFLIRPDGVLARVWPSTGPETDDELDAGCLQRRE